MHAKQVAINSLFSELNLSCTTTVLRLTSNVLQRKPYACECKMEAVLNERDAAHQLISASDKIQIIKKTRECEHATARCCASQDVLEIKEAAKRFVDSRTQTFKLLKQSFKK